MVMPEKVLAVSKLSPRNQSTIPSEVRSRLNIEPGDRLVWVEEDGKIVVKKA